ncbi:MAG: hypothetical protein AB7E72_14270 [Lysobacterales bacterium]
MEMPKQIETALRCMWIVLVLPPVVTTLVIGPFVIFMAPAFIAALLYQLPSILLISRSKSWRLRNAARLAYALITLALCSLSVISFFAEVGEESASSTTLTPTLLLLVAAMGVIGGLSWYAIFLMFREPGKRWFKRPA